MAERVVCVNGEMVPESQAVISYRDRGFRHGDAAFDTLRTFRHEIFLLDEHLDRLDRSLRYIAIDPGMDRAQLAALTVEVVRQNVMLLEPEDDYWVTIRVSRGEDPPTRGSAAPSCPTVVINCELLRSSGSPNSTPEACVWLRAPYDVLRHNAWTRAPRSRIT